MANVHLPIRQLVEFLLRTGSIDSRFTGFERANEGARIHRKLQKAAGEGYQAEVFLSAERETCGIAFTLDANGWPHPDARFVVRTPTYLAPDEGYAPPSPWRGTLVLE